VADRKRPADDAAGDPADDEVYAEHVAEDDEPGDDELTDEPVGRGGGTAVRERKAGAESPKAKREVRGSGIFGLIGRFIREVVGELRKVIWPTRKELLTYTGVVIAFVTVMTTIVGLLDVGFAKAILFAFGK
jgi:preprotein translocase subunit SecE